MRYPRQGGEASPQHSGERGGDSGVRAEAAAAAAVGRMDGWRAHHVPLLPLDVPGMLPVEHVGLDGTLAAAVGIRRSSAAVCPDPAAGALLKKTKR